MAFVARALENAQTWDARIHLACTRRPRRTSRYRSAAGQSENTAVSVSYPPSCSLAPLLQCNTYVDFKLEKMALQWLAIARGHRVIYGVRFNSECATVEAMWAYIVSVLRQILDGKAATLVTNVVSYLAHIRLSRQARRRWAALQLPDSDRA